MDRSRKRPVSPVAALASLGLATSLLAGAVAAAPVAGALPPGTVDTAFGTGGVAQVADPAPTGVARLVTDSSGRPLLLTTGTAPGVTRMTAAGVVDTAYGTAGRAALGTAASWFGLGAGPTGTSLAFGSGAGALVLRRLLGSGGSDPAFGTAGLATLTVPTAPTPTAPSGIAGTSDGGAFVWWQTGTAPVSSVVARVTATGTLDPAFGAGTPTPGVVTLAATAVTGLVADGAKPVIALLTSPGALAQLRRLTAAGVLDTTFASGGTGIHGLPTGIGSTGGVTLTPAGGYLVGGFQVSGLPGLGHLSAVAVTAAGVPDTAFGTGGLTVAQSWTCSGSTQPLATTTAVHLVGGACGGAAAVEVVRLSPAGAPDPRFGTGGHAALSDVGDIFVSAPAGAGIVGGQPVVGIRGQLSTGAPVVGLVRFRASTAVVAGGFVPVTPVRLLDTRAGAPVPAGGTLTLKVDTGSPGSGVPAGQAAAAVLNVTATGGTAAGDLVVFPAGAVAPTSSNVNYQTGQTIANQVTARLGTGGAVVVRNNSTGTVHLIVDGLGYYRSGTATAPGTFAALTPRRILDTRTGVGAPARAVPANGTVALTVTGFGGVPATGAGSVVLNVTATRPTAAGFVTVFPTGTALPTTSNVNFAAGQTIPNQVTVRLGTSGRVTLANRSTGTVQLIADVLGYYRSGTATAPGTFVPVGPVRILDTRQGTAGPITAGASRFASTTATTAIPGTGVAAAAFNITAVAPTTAGQMVVLPGDQPVFETSNVNFTAGRTIANQAVSGTGYLGIWVVNNGRGTVHAVVDVAGWFRS
jgi:hypothetical protein